MVPPVYNNTLFLFKSIFDGIILFNSEVAILPSDSRLFPDIKIIIVLVLVSFTTNKAAIVIKTAIKDNNEIIIIF